MTTRSFRLLDRLNEHLTLKQSKHIRVVSQVPNCVLPKTLVTNLIPIKGLRHSAIEAVSVFRNPEPLLFKHRERSVLLAVFVPWGGDFSEGWAEG